MQPRVYSYMRFSAARQAAGTSIERQGHFAREWAERNGLTLDEALTMRDEGLSAYHQKHVSQGALGAFLEAVRGGRIPEGSYLIVEGLDRLSRAEPIVAQGQLAQIINAGIAVVTAVDNRVYSRDTLRANPMDLIYSLLVMIRAHEESETKSRRVTESVARRCVAWIAGTYRGLISPANAPHWLHIVDGKFEAIPERVAVIRKAIAMYIQGAGTVHITKVLRDAGVADDTNWKSRSLYCLIVERPYLFAGTRIAEVDGESYVLEGYYPAIITPEEYASLKAAIARRKRAPRAAGGKSKHPSIFTGLGMLMCGRCGNKMVYSAHSATITTGKKLYRRFRCKTCEFNRELVAGLPAEGIERAIVDYCADRMELSDLIPIGADEASGLRTALSEAADQRTKNEAALSKIVDAMISSDDPPAAFMQRAKALEKAQADLAERIANIEAQLAEVASTDSEGLQAEWSAVRTGVLALDHDSRLRCRSLVANTFISIQVFPTGALPTTPPGCADVLLRMRSGHTRLLTIDRTTGDLVRGLERTPVVSG